jgi:hypothetical protein
MLDDLDLSHKKIPLRLIIRCFDYALTNHKTVLASGPAARWPFENPRNLQTRLEGGGDAERPVDHFHKIAFLAQNEFLRSCLLKVDARLGIGIDAHLVGLV